MKKIIPLLLLAFSIQFVYSQKIDSTQIGKKYPYILPILGKKAYEKGHTLPKPFGAMLTSVFNKQEIILEDFEMAIRGDGDPVPGEGDYKTLDGIFEFGPSEGLINTLNFRADAWVLPFLSVGGYYGKVWGEQTISFELFESGNLIESTTDINGQYYGLNLLGVVPLGPVNVAGDYSWSWTTNDRLDKPVKVEVSGLRIIRRVPSANKNRYFAYWGGAQFQKLDSRTSGNIPFDEALGVTEEDKAQMESDWNDHQNSPEWDALTPAEKIFQTTAYNLVTGVVDSDVYYQFNKKLKYNWNMLIGCNYQLSEDWQFRGEYGFLKSKQQLMLSVNYRFGL